MTVGKGATVASTSNTGTFWSNLGSSLGTGLGQGLQTVTGQILPVWTAKQLNLQQQNQLNAPTYVQPGQVQQTSNRQGYIEVGEPMSQTTMIVGAAALAMLVYLVTQK